MKQNMQDLTEGPLGKKILIFSVPLMLSNLLQVLFNMADIAVIGQFAGSLSLGAVGSTATLVTMFTGFLIGLSGGINVLTALYYGAKDRESLSKTIHSAALVSLIMGVLLLVLGVGLSEWMLTMLKTREELLDKQYCTCGSIIWECRRWPFTTLVMRCTAQWGIRRSLCIILVFPEC